MRVNPCLAILHAAVLRRIFYCIAVLITDAFASTFTAKAHVYATVELIQYLAFKLSSWQY